MGRGKDIMILLYDLTVHFERFIVAVLFFLIALVRWMMLAPWCLILGHGPGKHGKYYCCRCGKKLNAQNEAREDRAGRNA